MSITDELRVCARTFIGVWVDSVSQTITFTTSDVPPTVDSIRMDSSLLAIADRIDAAHEEAIKSVMNDALYHANDKDMADLGWVRLPEDADGECIHVGDELRDEWHEQNQGEVEWLMLDHHGWWLMLKNSCERFYVHEFHEWRHHHAPTVEDTLREMLDKWGEMPSNMTNEAIVAEYAKRLTLRGDGE